MNIKMMNTLHGCVDGYMHKDGYQKGGGGGGGQQTTTSSSGFAQEYKPQISRMLDSSESAYNAGQLGKVAGFDKYQTLAHSRGGDVADIQDNAARGGRNALDRLSYLSGPRDLRSQRLAASMDAKKALGMANSNASRRGGLGGSSQFINQQSIGNDLAAKFAGIDQAELTRQGAANQAVLQGAGVAQQQAGAGTNTIGQIGQARQQQSQNQADAKYKALNQWIGLFSGVAPKETTSTREGGGGGK